MDPSELRNLLEELKEYVNYAEIARASEGLKQEMNYWLYHPEAESKFSPEKGIHELKQLCQQVKSADVISPELYKRWTKFLNMRQVCIEFFGKPSSTVAVTISRKGVNHYRKEIKTANKFVYKKLINVKKRKKIKLKKSKIGIKLKKK